MVRSTRLMAWTLVGAAGMVLCRPAVAWQSFVDSVPNANGEVRDLVSDPAGNALAVGTILDFTVAKLAGDNGAELWRQEVVGTGAVAGKPRAVESASNGDAIVAGSVTNIGTGRDFVVARLASSNGSELWRATLNGSSGAGDEAESLAVDASGDVIAAGRLDNLSSFWDLTVVKLAGATGNEIWRYTKDGTASQSEEALEVEVDPAGDVVAGGYIRNNTTGADMVIVKLSGANGAELWRTEIAGANAGNDQALDLALDDLGDVVVGGFIFKGATTRDLIVLKLSGIDGSILWRHEVDGGAGKEDQAAAVVVNGGGVAFAAGRLIGNATDADLAVVALASNGSVLWTHLLNGRGNDFDEAKDIAVGLDGDPVVAGFVTGSTTQRDFVALRLRKADGAEVWRREVNGIADLDDEARAIDTGPGGRVFVGGTVWREEPVGPIREKDPSREYTVFRLEGDTGADLRLLSGRRFVLLDKQITLRNQRLALVSRDKQGVVPPVAGSPSDPRSVSAGGSGAGGRVSIRNPTTGEFDIYPLPADKWKTIGPASSPSGFKYHDPGLEAGPCRNVVIRKSRALRALCSGAQIQFTLDESSQGALAGMISLGQTPVSYCTEFGGTVVKDQPLAGFFKRGVFKARNAPQAAVCNGKLP
jgi:hypothetical protein